ncbi:MAG: MoaD/ThiS family protein [Pirellulaceae bacterium]|nr:MoaD/ThiS family protein [Pirellulaceae bacterium]
MKIQVIYTGRGYQLAELLPDELELDDAAGVGDALRLLAKRLPADVRLPDTCLISVSGQHLGTLAQHNSVRLRDGDELTLIAPVAGG